MNTQSIRYSRLIVGFYCYEGKSLILKLTLHAYCVLCLMIILGSIFMFPEIKSHSILPINPFYVNVSEYAVNSIAALILKGKFIGRLESLVTFTDRTFTFDYPSMDKKVYIIMSITMTIRIVLFLIFPSDLYSLLDYFHIFLLFSSYIGYISKITVFHLLYTRMNLLNKYMEAKCRLVNVILDGNCSSIREYRKKYIDTCLNVYECLVSFVEEMDHEILIWVR